MRKILHLDMDAFFASVEQRDNPDLQNKPIAVGGGGERGVVAAASYEARKFGVKSAMNGSRAKGLCKDLIFVPPHFEKYKRVSSQIHEIFSRYTDKIEPLSLDEAYLDITENKLNLNSGTYIAQAIKNDVFNETGLVVSAGVSYNKFLAKMASDQDKPDGLFVIQPEEGEKFIEKLDIKRFYGVGKVTANKMNELGIFKGKDLLRFTERELINYFGKSGSFLFKIARGEDNREVLANRERKSIGVETTYDVNIDNETLLWEESKKLLETLWGRMERNEGFGRTLSMKIRNDNFETYSKSKTVNMLISSKEELYNLSVLLFNTFLPIERPIRLLGFSVSGFDLDGFEFSQLEMNL
jgi:DNA polymerase-4